MYFVFVIICVTYFTQTLINNIFVQLGKPKHSRLVCRGTEATTTKLEAVGFENTEFSSTCDKHSPSGESLSNELLKERKITGIHSIRPESQAY